MAGGLLRNVGGAADWSWGDSVRRVAGKFCVEPPARVLKTFKKKDIGDCLTSIFDQWQK